jgi:uncharacterized damage-inducible protein DinB
LDTTWKAILWDQFGAAIDTLENALVAAPDQLWSDRSRRPEFWYLVYHTLVFVDLYLSGSLEGFHPPAPFTLDEVRPNGVLPEQAYTKDELQNYLEHCREKGRTTIEALTDERGCERCVFPWLDISFAELLLYNMRHVQHHAAQLNLILRQTVDSAPRWVFRARR